MQFNQTPLLSELCRHWVLRAACVLCSSPSSPKTAIWLKLPLQQWPLIELTGRFMTSMLLIRSPGASMWNGSLEKERTETRT